MRNLFLRSATPNVHCCCSFNLILISKQQANLKLENSKQKYKNNCQQQQRLSIMSISDNHINYLKNGRSIIRTSNLKSFSTISTAAAAAVMSAAAAPFPPLLTTMSSTTTTKTILSSPTSFKRFHSNERNSHQMTDKEKPLNVLISIDEEILDEQQKLELEQPLILNGNFMQTPIQLSSLTPATANSSSSSSAATAATLSTAAAIRKLSNSTLLSPILRSQITTAWISNSSIIFKSIRKLLYKIIGIDRFTIYPITNDEIKSKPWQQTTALLIIIINSRKYKEEDEYLISADKVIKEFISNGGLVVIYRLDELWDLSDYLLSGENGLCKNIFKQKLINKCGKQFFKFNLNTHGNGNSVNSINVSGKRLIRFEDDDVDLLLPKLTPIYFLTQDLDLIDKNLISRVNNNNRCSFYLTTYKDYCEREELRKIQQTANYDDDNYGNDAVDFTREQLFSRQPIIYECDINSITPTTIFNFDTYYSNLASSRLGHHILFSDVTTSTMNIIEPFTKFDGLIAIANQQTEGKGRGENQWISPKGSLAFTLHFTISLKSNLGQRLGFVQHLAALAIIKAILNSTGYNHLDLRIKWPNDIYWGRESKIGGILVTSRLEGHDVHCFIGCGLNVSNAFPTYCIDYIVKNSIDANTGGDNKTINNLPLLTREEILARSLNEFECLLKRFERENMQNIKDEYLKHWLHSGQCVRMANTKEVIIEGLDDQGYLLVKEVSTGLYLSVHPDGNRFDMLNNLLVRKI